MKNKYSIVLLCLWLLAAACAPKEGIFRPAEPGRALFEKAEQKFDQAEYAEAQSLYRKYIQEYPDAGQAPEARLKLGRIRAETEEFNAARDLYLEVIARYPGTPQAEAARIKTLETYVNQGYFQEAILYRRQIPEDKLSPETRLEADLLTGDAHMALGQYPRAYQVFMEAYQRAEPDARQKMTDRLLAAISGLNTDYIRSEIERLEGSAPSGYLMYQQGLNAISESRVGDALSILNRFLKRYPDHPEAERVREQIASLTSAAFFEGHTIGCVLPLTGKYRKFGRQALRGVELAMLHASRRMKVDPPFRILVRDSSSEVETGRLAVEELAKKRVAAIIGPIAAPAEAAETAHKRGVPIFPFTQKSDIAEGSDFVFINFLTPRMQVSALAAYTTRELACRRFAVLYPDEPYGRTFLHLFWDQLIEHNAQLVGAESYNPQHTDFAGPIKKLVGLYYELPEDLAPETMTPVQLERFAQSLQIYGGVLSVDPFAEMDKRTEPGGGVPVEPYDFGMGDRAKPEEEPEPIVDFDAILVPDSPEKAGLIIPQLRFYDINNVYLLGTNLWHSQKLIDIAGYQIGQAVIPEGFFAQSSRALVTEFVRSFDQIYGYTPGFMEAVGYDSAMILCRQISRKDVSTRPALQQALVRMPPYNGVTGQTVFRKSGEADKSIYLLSVENGDFAEIPR